MSHVKPIVLAISTLLLAASAGVGAASNEPQHLGDRLRAELSAAILAEGLDPPLFFSSTTTLFVHDAEHGVAAYEMTFGDALDVLYGDARIQSAPGIGGTPAEIVAGDFVHTALKTGRNNALPYSITSSALVPSTAPVVVPVFDPCLLLGTPCVGIQPMVVYDTGGKVLNVKGSGYAGLHSAGTLIPAASTAASGPYLPQKDTLVMLSDSSIDYVGHGVFAQAQACLFGFCAGVGVGLAGLGVAQFDAQRIVLPTGHSTTTAFPIIP